MHGPEIHKIELVQIDMKLMIFLSIFIIISRVGLYLREIGTTFPMVRFNLMDTAPPSHFLLYIV
jgi:hypothetical protein